MNGGELIAKWRWQSTEELRSGDLMLPQGGGGIPDTNHKYIAIFNLLEVATELVAYLKLLIFGRNKFYITYINQNSSLCVQGRDIQSATSDVVMVEVSKVRSLVEVENLQHHDEADFGC